ncbi:MAG: hypothetical protein IPN95_03230 [Bacteroidetes bacterium]|jgi:hypothetical protein|nr:hypothetical protein [Bacteroidota bacterium]MBL0017946.1 hypothetical protein [Bacteroidota bacterium]MBP6639310.1 hypothetical protein [Bacteroidia bacterium]
MKLMRVAFASLVVIGLLSGCKEDLVRIPCDGSSPVWNGEVFEIVAATCLGSSCHGSGSSRGDFNSYAGIEPYLLDNSFEISVLQNRTMPQNGTLPDSSLAALQCWLENGFPEN